MSVPQFEYLGKTAKDIFYKNYDLGIFKLGVKTKRSTGMLMTSSIATELDTFNSYGVLETLHKIEEYGACLKQKYDTKNIFLTEITLVDQIAKGSQISLNCSYAAEPGTITSHIKGNFANDITAMSVDVDLNLTKPTIISSAVLACNGWLGGIQTTLNPRKMIVVGNNFALGYVAQDFVFHSTFSDGTKFTGSFYQKMDPNLEIGIQVLSTSETNETLLGIGCRYQLDPEASVSAKINTRGQLGLAYLQKLQEGISLSISGLYSINEFSAGGQRLGASLNFEL